MKDSQEHIKMLDINISNKIENTHFNISKSDQASDRPLDYPTLMLTLLSDDWLFFNDAEIIWNGEHHDIRGIQFNPQKKSDLLDFVNVNIDGFISSSEVKDYLLSFINNVENDDGLIIGRERISKDARRFLKWGSLTGATLMNLVASDIKYRFFLKAEDDYEVVFDERLAKGIPQFFNLTARLLWDLRSCTKSQKDKPFIVRFSEVSDSENSKSHGAQIQPVADAQMVTSLLRVEDSPEINLHATQKEDVSFSVSSDYSNCKEKCDGDFDWDEIERKRYREEIRAKLLILKFCRTDFPSAYLKDAYDQQPDRDEHSDISQKRLWSIASSISSIKTFLLSNGERINVGGRLLHTYVRNYAGEEYFNNENIQWLIEHDYDVSNPPEKVRRMTFDQRMRLANESLLSKNKDINGNEIEDPIRTINDLKRELRELGSFEQLINSAKENIEGLNSRYEKAKSELRALDRYAFLRKKRLETELAELHQQIRNETTLLSELENRQRKRESIEHRISELKRQREEMKDLLPWY